MSRRIAILLFASLLSAAGGGCSSVMTGLVGDPHGPQGAPKSNTPTPFTGLSYSSNNFDSQSTRFGGGIQAIMPPTLPAAPGADEVENTESVGTAGPRPPIAVAPLTQDSAQLAGLGSAAVRVGGKDHSRFVLLVLTPAPADAAAIGTIGAQSRAAADAALHAIAAAGVDAGRVEISSATAAAGGPGEMRLYVR